MLQNRREFRGGSCAISFGSQWEIPVLNKFSTRYFTIVWDFVDFLGIVRYCAGLTELCGPAPAHPVRRHV